MFHSVLLLLALIMLALSTFNVSSPVNLQSLGLSFWVSDLLFKLGGF